MTTIAYKDGLLAADSRCTIDTDAGGARVFSCEKLFRKEVLRDGKLQEVILATAGDASPGMAFVDWYGSGLPPIDNFVLGDADFSVLVLTHDGLFEYDQWCHGIKILDPIYAIGSGTKAALGAMHMGAGPKKAVEIACLIDPYTAGPIVTMRLKKPRAPEAEPAEEQE